MSAVNSRVQGFLKNNQKFTETWKTPATMEKMRAASFKNGGAVIILTCLDPRTVPEEFLGPNIHAPAIRNAGGRATQDAITSITVLRSLMGAEAVLVIHHTDCGLTHITDDQIRKEAKQRTPHAAEEVDATKTYGCFDAADFEKAIRDDVETLKRAKVLAGMEIRGFAMDTESGVVTELDAQDKIIGGRL